MTEIKEEDKQFIEDNKRFKRGLLKTSIVMVLSCLTIVLVYQFLNPTIKTTEDMLEEISSFYEGEIEVLEVLEIEESKVISFIAEGMTGVASFTHDENDNYDLAYIDRNLRVHIVNYGRDDEYLSKNMLVTIITDQRIHEVRLEVNDMLKETWKIDSSEPVVLYYNEEEIQDSKFSCRLLLLDEEGNPVDYED